MVNSIYGISIVYAANSVNSIYGVNSYKSYLNSIANRQSTNQISAMLNTSLNNVGLTGSSQSGSSAYSNPLNQMNQLNQTINSIYLNRTANPLNNKIVESTDDNAVSATAQWNASVKSYDVKVSNLAATQVNTGAALAADDKSVIGPSFNTFKIKTGNSEKNISVVLNSTDTNKTAFTKLAAAINRSDAGVKTSVATDSANKTYLMLESAKTGAKNAFSITELQGNAISATGLGNVKSKAQDAVYTVDNRQYTSSTNTISLDSGKVQATLKKAGSNQVSINVVPDTSSKSLPDFYSYLNNMLSKGNYNTNRNTGSLFDMFL